MLGLQSPSSSSSCRLSDSKRVPNLQDSRCLKSFSALPKWNPLRSSFFLLLSPVLFLSVFSVMWGCVSPRFLPSFSISFSSSMVLSLLLFLPLPPLSLVLVACYFGGRVFCGRPSGRFGGRGWCCSGCFRVFFFVRFVVCLVFFGFCFFSFFLLFFGFSVFRPVKFSV